MKPLFLPVSFHREATRVPSLFWNVSILPNVKSSIFDRKTPIHSIKASRPTTSTPPEVMTKSSATKRAAACGSFACQTSRQKLSTISTALLSGIFYLLEFGLGVPFSGDAGLMGETSLRDDHKYDVRSLLSIIQTHKVNGI
jgi:hypothetical protein